MSDDAAVCECSHNDGNLPEGLSYNKEKSGCCTSEISELTNSNLLATVKIELPNDINSFGAIIFHLNQSPALGTGQFSNVSIDKSHLPKLDIPIFISSLLI